MTGAKVRLVDVPGESGRTTVSLLSSLAARLAALALASGSDVAGAVTAGYAAVGRAAADTAEGALMRRAIESSRAGSNGEAIWHRLRMGEWAGSLPPVALLQHFQNDVALLAAEDLDRALELPLAPAEPYGAADAPRPEPAEFADYLLGMWVFGRSVARAVEQLVQVEPDQPVPSGGLFEPGRGAPDSSTGPLLR
jgi:hypothetical protein